MEGDIVTPSFVCTLAYPLSSQNNKELQDARLLALIKGINSQSPSNDMDVKNDKRGQGWAIAYGKRGSQKWSMAYGKRNSIFDKERYSQSPRFYPTKRTFSTDQTYYTWGQKPIKRQQGWHIAYGKRSIFLPEREY
ncbi:hypothetical protein FSP39_018294 [Pinctada imbricata]|uniref:Uncharacterized protein n=1 Tax=Pinctada imbricata TaxID=66713 RepID=A0AA88YRT4_PINIB|nr:hypothetical protein FSP39_018294 [Pinctada imbricata]